MTVIVNMMIRPSFLPITSKIRARGSLATPATMVEIILVVPSKPCLPKLLVTNGSRDADICCCNESVKNTIQILYEGICQYQDGWSRRIMLTRYKSQ